MIPLALFTDTFKIIKTEQSLSNGKVTHKIHTVSIGNRGRFSDISGSRSRIFIGSYGNATKILYCEINDDIIFGRIIEDEGCDQYDIIRVDKKKFFGGNHHMQVLLDQRATNIS